MASFTNMATLSYNGSQINSNVVTGELRDALTITKTAVSGGYRPGLEFFDLRLRQRRRIILRSTVRFVIIRSRAAKQRQCAHAGEQKGK